MKFVSINGARLVIECTDVRVTYARINKLKASKADRAAAAAGKTWDAINGGWK